MLKYARKCGAKFTVCNADGWPADKIKHPWQKIIHLWELLDQWDQVLFLDNDALVNADAMPNLFDMVPLTHVGAFKEGAICNRAGNLSRVLGYNRLNNGGRPYDSDYINTGVMLLSKLHRDMFVWPDVLIDDYYEQSYINARLFAAHVPIQSLSYKFNRMSVLDSITGEQRHASHIVHYAGSNDYEKIADDMQDMLELWEAREPAETNIVIECTGGIGDVVYAEPVIRYLIEQKYKDIPNVNFHISTQRPRLFKHFNYPNVTVKSGPFEFNDTRYYPVAAIQCHPHTNNVIRAMFPYQAVHNLDFQAHAMILDYLPAEYKTPKLCSSEYEHHSLYAKMLKEVHNYSVPNLIAVHAGRGWKSKTFPFKFWQAVVDELSSAGMSVVLFGQEGKLNGVVPVECPIGGIDLRNQLDLGETIALLEICPKLLTNESSPLCMAGAFDNEIYLVAGPKAPELVMPYRNGSVHYKTHAIRGKWIVSDKIGVLPTDPARRSISEIPEGYTIEDFTPSVESVIAEILK